MLGLPCATLCGEVINAGRLMQGVGRSGDAQVRYLVMHARMHAHACKHYPHCMAIAQCVACPSGLHRAIGPWHFQILSNQGL